MAWGIFLNTKKGDCLCSPEEKPLSRQYLYLLA